MSADATSFRLPDPAAVPVDQAIQARAPWICQQCGALCMQAETRETRLCCVCRGDPEHVGVHVL